MGRRISENSLSSEDYDAAQGERSHSTAGQETSGLRFGRLGLGFVSEINLLYTPGGVHGTAGRGTQCSGLGDRVGIAQRLDSLILEGFSNLKDSMK